MINKYYVRKIKKILEKNTRYETIRMWDEPTPYIMTNEKDYNNLLDILKGDNNESNRFIKYNS